MDVSRYMDYIAHAQPQCILRPFTTLRSPRSMACSRPGYLNSQSVSHRNRLLETISFGRAGCDALDTLPDLTDADAEVAIALLRRLEVVPLHKLDQWFQKNFGEVPPKKNTDYSRRVRGVAGKTAESCTIEASTVRQQSSFDTKLWEVLVKNSQEETLKPVPQNLKQGKKATNDKGKKEKPVQHSAGGWFFR
eukprot:CAMPEP_0197864944 /NCGR_PEP_ID=MMETSP1438-20131217/43377_1 /TAXON_ID=1461541 /ORGANISM="Pterosperma sp., Strain CCMP1384" /LENGTH=191 /DNA_ID=CAMNT_0043483327 /DNA_START=227 /DNA_END=802 /DNA_ORIENTATION=-